MAGRGTGELVEVMGGLDMLALLRDADATTAVRLDLAAVFAGRDLEAEETFELYEAFGRFFGLIHRSAKWWLADWLNFGEGAFGHRFTQALEATGLSEGYLRNIMWVGANVAPSRRRKGVAFSFHETVAPLPPDAQRHWLSVVAKPKEDGKAWTQRELRYAIKGEPEPAQADTDEEHDADRSTVPLNANRILEKANLVAAWATREGPNYIVPAEAFVQLLAAIGKGE